jgi:hypothetical protein
MGGRMTDEQFDRLHRLLNLCKQKNMDVSIRHRIALEIAHAGNIDLRIQDFESAVDSGQIPATSGIPRKITLLSDGQGYGPRPGEDEEVSQRLTINDRGEVYITYYNCLGVTLRKERFQIPVEEAAILLQDINTTFAIRTDGEMVTDVGLWKLTITNTEGQSSSFDGSLYFAPDSPLANLSENLRNILDRPMLLGFDGAAEELLQFVSVHFEYGGKEYCYLGDDTRLSIGDKVEVPVGDHGKKAVATVVGVEYGTEKDAPFPADRIKRIISKKEPVVPEASGETPFDAVKAVIDDLDPEYLLADLAPDDEYDGESEHIANAITAEMTPQQIAEIMAKEFSWSFSCHYDANYFMVAATRVKAALTHAVAKEPATD